MTDIDLGFNPFEPRDKFGRWIKGVGLRDTLNEVEPGAKFRTESGTIYTKDNLGGWADAYGRKATAKGFEALGQKGFLQTVDDVQRQHNALMAARDQMRLASKTKGKKRTTSLSTERSGDVDLALSQGFGARRKKGVVQHVTPQAQAKVARRQVKTFKRQFGNADQATLQAHAAQPGHYRAKAILAQQAGHTRYAAKLTAKAHAVYTAHHPAQTPAGQPHPSNVQKTSQGWTKHTQRAVVAATQARPQAPAQANAKPKVTGRSKTFTPVKAKRPKVK
jgi:hypothetical protein